MIRVDRAELTRNEIIRVAANRFLNDGYSNTTVNSLSKALGMSTGNITFHFPTKEHLLTSLANMLCAFQWELLKEETKEGYSPILAVCLELMSIASACEQDEIAKDFFLSTYRSPMCLEVIRENDEERAKDVFREYCSDWTDAQFKEAEVLVSGIEYATLTTSSDSVALEQRVEGALDAILSIYNVPKDIREKKIKKVTETNYRELGLRVLKEFREYVDKTTEQALFDLLTRKSIV